MARRINHVLKKIYSNKLQSKGSISKATSNLCEKSARITWEEVWMHTEVYHDNLSKSKFKPFEALIDKLANLIEKIQRPRSRLGLGFETYPNLCVIVLKNTIKPTVCTTIDRSERTILSPRWVRNWK
jgi:hypothetical protein